MTDAILLSKLQVRFSAELPELAGEIARAARAKNWQHASERAHYLKNSADCVGARSLGRACQLFCTQAETGRDGELVLLAGSIAKAARNPFGLEDIS
jgi:HPt (histidine-containing phosphotransfer) domain-containing protein